MKYIVETYTWFCVIDGYGENGKVSLSEGNDSITN